ncbi:hypothetical protein BN1723_000793 [Verticillium longisporum]|uniref:Glucose-methanol-choline oxidoreductase N-terminal domain-containing protein n=1 Tax=Verticillium longisporum TaxID=100787 RepID=A0A0G4N7G7_VERLO|nr:hypothetical protein BN1723_000793 [Verticillium longisporum]
MKVSTLLLSLLAASVSAVPSQLVTRQTGTILASYDYVIVGSGPGGGPLAARLAIAGKKVLLIEAGDDQGASIPYQVPALNLQSTEYTPMQWDYFVNHYSSLDAQTKDSKMTYRTASGELYSGLSPPSGATPLGVLYPRAGTLGGCAAHNALITVYPHASDWDRIATLTSDTSWRASAMRNYFKRLESARYLPNGVAGHGFSGWLTTSVTDLGLVVKDLKLRSSCLASSCFPERDSTEAIRRIRACRSDSHLEFNGAAAAADVGVSETSLLGSSHDVEIMRGGSEPKRFAVDPSDSVAKSNHFIIASGQAHSMLQLKIQLQRLSHQPCQRWTVGLQNMALSRL